MKRSSVSLILALLLAEVVPAAAKVLGPEAQTASYDFGPKVNNFALAIKLDSSSVDAGAPIGGVLAIKNFGPPTKIFRLGSLLEYKFTGTTPDGSPLQPGPGVPFSGSVTTGLDEETGHIYLVAFDDLGKWYDLKRPGAYSFYAETGLAGGPGAPNIGNLKSNPVTLVVR